MVLQKRRGRAHETRATRSDKLDSGATSREGIREILFHVDGEYISEVDFYIFPNNKLNLFSFGICIILGKKNPRTNCNQKYFDQIEIEICHKSLLSEENLPNLKILILYVKYYFESQSKFSNFYYFLCFKYNFVQIIFYKRAM